MLIKFHLYLRKHNLTTYEYILSRRAAVSANGKEPVMSDKRELGDADIGGPGDKNFDFECGKNDELANIEVKSCSPDEGEAMEPAYQIVNEISGASFQNRDSFDKDLEDSKHNSDKKDPLVHREFSGEINHTNPKQVSREREDSSLGTKAICGGAFRVEDGKFLQAKYSLEIRQYRS